MSVLRRRPWLLVVFGVALFVALGRGPVGHRDQQPAGLAALTAQGAKFARGPTGSYIGIPVSEAQ